MIRRQNELRIIGGEWRGRRLRFPDAEGLRPTADRVRETLFNWLQAYIPGARCLDLFAGSGAMGLEAVSRGAELALMVDRSREALESLERNRALLKSDRIRPLQQDALRLLEGTARERFDVVFLDPPFDSDIIGSCCERLERGGWLADTAFVYLEQDKSRPLPPLPANWTIHRSGTAGRVGYYLARRTSDTGS